MIFLRPPTVLVRLEIIYARRGIVYVRRLLPFGRRADVFLGLPYYFLRRRDVSSVVPAF